MKRAYKVSILSLVLTLLTPVISLGYVQALGSPQTPQSGAMGLEATIPSPPPSTPATIAIPSNNQSFTTIPISVSGICPNNLLIKLFSNGVFVGSAACQNGSYSLKIDLFNGLNKLNAQDFDALGQGGPLSNTVNVSYSGPQSAAANLQVTVTSFYAEQGANPGQEISWPIIINGGVPPYAISTDWGDGQPPTLQSSATGGNVTIKHAYQSSGLYDVTVTVSDSNGSTGFLQLVGVGNGQVTQNNSSSPSKSSQSTSSAAKFSVPGWVFILIVLALVPAFWLGYRHGKTVLMRKFQ